MNSDKEILIQRYFENNLDYHQKQKFEELMATDPEFNAEVNFQQKVKKAIELKEISSLKSHLQSIDASKKISSLWWYAAASVLLLLGITWWISSPGHLKTNQFYTAYFEPYPNVVAPLVRSNQGDEELASRAFAFYDQGLYGESAVAFEQLYRESRENYALLYQAISLMADGHTEKAIPLLEGQDWSEAPTYTSVASWYLALAYLNNQQASKAEPLLQNVADSDHNLSIPAKKILEEL